MLFQIVGWVVLLSSLAILAICVYGLCSEKHENALDNSEKSQARSATVMKVDKASGGSDTLYSDSEDDHSRKEATTKPQNSTANVDDSQLGADSTEVGGLLPIKSPEASHHSPMSFKPSSQANTTHMPLAGIQDEGVNIVDRETRTSYVQLRTMLGCNNVHNPSQPAPSTDTLNATENVPNSLQLEFHSAPCSNPKANVCQ